MRPSRAIVSGACQSVHATPLAQPHRVEEILPGFGLHTKVGERRVDRVDLYCRAEHERTLPDNCRGLRAQATGVLSEDEGDGALERHPRESLREGNDRAGQASGLRGTLDDQAGDFQAAAQ